MLNIYGFVFLWTECTGSVHCWNLQPQDYISAADTTAYLHSHSKLWKKLYRVRWSITVIQSR